MCVIEYHKKKYRNLKESIQFSLSGYYYFLICLKAKDATFLIFLILIRKMVLAIFNIFWYNELVVLILLCIQRNGRIKKIKWFVSLFALLLAPA